MAKENGLNVRLYVEGYDISGDANSLASIGYSNTLFEIATLDVSGMKRFLGPADGSVEVNGYFDNAAGRIHPVFTSNSGKLPTADQGVMIPLGSAVGDPAVGMVTKEANYDTDRGGTSAITVKSAFSVNGYPPEFSTMLPAHTDTVTASTSGTAVDDSASSSSGGSWFYQILAISASGGNARWTVKLQHSTNNITYTDVSSANVTAIGAARAEFTGTLNRYIRNRLVLDATSGSITFAICYNRA